MTIKDIDHPVNPLPKVIALILLSTMKIIPHEKRHSLRFKER